MNSLHLYERLIFLSLECIMSFDKKRPCLFEKSQGYMSLQLSARNRANLETHFGLVLFLSAMTGWEG